MAGPQQLIKGAVCDSYHVLVLLILECSLQILDGWPRLPVNFIKHNGGIQTNPFVLTLELLDQYRQGLFRLVHVAECPGRSNLHTW